MEHLKVRVEQPDKALSADVEHRRSGLDELVDEHNGFCNERGG
jgi:hypothetical protein